MTAEQLSQLLDELGKRLGPAGEHVFQLAVRQQYINGLSVLITLIVVIILSAILFKISHSNRSDNLGEIGMLVTGAVFGFSLLCLVLSVTLITSQLLNPEYAALQDILKSVK